jgi:hypothetical protein
MIFTAATRWTTFFLSKLCVSAVVSSSAFRSCKFYGKLAMIAALKFCTGGCHEANSFRSRSRPRCTVLRSAQTPFYQDKTIRIIAGFGAGSTDDAWSRLIARYLAKYIPDNPNMIVQNMPSGAMIAANYVYKVPSPTG